MNIPLWRDGGPASKQAKIISGKPVGGKSKDLELEIPDDLHIPENYVEHVLRTQKALPDITWSNWYKNLNAVNCIIVLGTPLLAFVGALYTPLQRKTAIWMVAYYFITGLGITAGYHRLWSHRAYNASLPLKIILALAGAGSAQGSIKWWCTKHRAHHRYTDTDLDPYNAHKGLFYAHFGWMLLTPRRASGVADISDLRKDPVVRWQHDHYVPLLVATAYILPTVVAGYFWGDWKGGYVYAGLARLCFVHQSTFCVNSLAHYLGETTFDDKHSPRDHLFTALVTIGEGYHNFHHQFPMDYRNAIRWYQYDPTKWFIKSMSFLGVASHLKAFPDNEVEKGVLTMKLRKLRETQEKISWPRDNSDLPVISWDNYQKQAAKRNLVLIGGFIHDVGTFMDEHPGGKHLISRNIGKDASTAFFGGVYDHSNAAHNLLAMKRVGALHGGAPHGLEEKMVPPSQRLKIARYNELAGPDGGATAVEDNDESEEEYAKGDSMFN